jgi:hypothetical protein
MLLWVVVYPVLFYLQGLVAIFIQLVLTDRPSGGIVGTLVLLAFWTSWVATKAIRKKVLPGHSEKTSPPTSMKR